MPGTGPKKPGSKDFHQSCIPHSLAPSSQPSGENTRLERQIYLARSSHPLSHHPAKYARPCDRRHRGGLPGNGGRRRWCGVWRRLVDSEPGSPVAPRQLGKPSKTLALFHLGNSLAGGGHFARDGHCRGDVGRAYLWNLPLCAHAARRRVARMDCFLPHCPRPEDR